MHTPLVILDRDGTVNHDSDDYIKSADEWVALPGAIDAKQIEKLLSAAH